jgi:hypothetical protein
VTVDAADQLDWDGWSMTNRKRHTGVPVLPLPLTGWAAAKPANPHTAMATSVDRRVMFTVQAENEIHRVWECEGFYMT